MDYKERPVDILTFIKDEYFLGKSLDHGNAVYGAWRNKLYEMFLHDEKYIVVLTGAIGIGKTTIALIAGCYIMYRICCLKDPWKFFNLAKGGKMAIAFFNLTKSLGQSKGYAKMQSFLTNSKWFLDNGGIIRGDKDKYLDHPYFTYVLGSPYSSGYSTVGHDVVYAIMDEVDSSTESQSSRTKILKAYESTVRRFESRFVTNDKALGRFFLVASKQDEMSFLNTFVDKMRGSGKIYIADLAFWEVKNTNYCGEKFPVLIGDIYTPPRILEKEEIDNAILNGFEVKMVPVEHREEFEADLVGSLRDIAGISIHGLRKSKFFPSDKFINEAYALKSNKQDPVTTCPIEIGLADEIDLIHFIQFDKITIPKHVERFFHYDISLTGDCSGLAMSCVSAWENRQVENKDGTYDQQLVPIVETEFVFKIKAKPGDEIPFHKIRKLVLDLYALGFNVALFTADLRIGSADSLQLLNRAGIKSEYLSIDRDITPYLVFRNLAFEKRWICFRNPYLHSELKNLEYDRARNKIDHPDEIRDTVINADGTFKDFVYKGEKDMSDSLVGSVYNAVMHAKKPLEATDVISATKTLMHEDAVTKNPLWWVKDERSDKPVIGEVKSDLHKFADLLEDLKNG